MTRSSILASKAGTFGTGTLYSGKHISLWNAQPLNSPAMARADEGPPPIVGRLLVGYKGMYAPLGVWLEGTSGAFPARTRVTRLHDIK